MEHNEHTPADYATVERQLRESQAQSFANVALAYKAMKKMKPSHGSAIVVSLTWLGGREVCTPFAVTGGLSAETIAALAADIEHSLADTLELAGAFAGAPLNTLKKKAQP